MGEEWHLHEANPEAEGHEEVAANTVTPKLVQAVLEDLIVGLEVDTVDTVGEGLGHTD